MIFQRTFGVSWTAYTKPITDKVVMAHTRAVSEEITTKMEKKETLILPPSDAIIMNCVSASVVEIVSGCLIMTELSI